MIQSSNLLRDLQGRLKPLIADLTERVHHDEAIHTRVEAQYQAAFDAQRTGWTFTAWADDLVNQVAVGWLLACVFVRFVEDNNLIDDARIAGVAARGEEARLAQRDFFGANPHASDRDYLHDTFTSAACAPRPRRRAGHEAQPPVAARPVGRRLHRPARLVSQGG
ncbi:MAG: hypothetical protein V9F04_04735 [Dermatophilaceae bacterium]